MHLLNCVTARSGYGGLLWGTDIATAGCHVLMDNSNEPNRCHCCRVQITGYPTSIASMAFSHSGDTLAVASSYMYEFGERQGGPPDEIYIRPVTEAEVKPKPRKAAA